MLCRDKITSIFCIIDDILKEINHSEDIRRKVSDSEIITTAFIAATNFYGNYRSAIKFVKQYNLFPNMLEESRFNRRLHSLGNMLYELFHLIASFYKEITCEMNYIIDSFPIPICQNIRINRCRIAKGKQYRGYTASMRTYFYGIKVQLVTTGEGIPIAFHFTVGKTADVKALDKITEIFPPEAKLYGDSAYTDYQIEDYLFENKCVELKTQRKKNSKRPDSEKQSRQKLKMRKRVEVAISDIKKMFPRTIHSVTLKGFLIKITMYIFGLQLFKIINN